MVDYKNCVIANIIDDAKKNDHVDYLKTLASKTYKKKDGGKRKASFFEIKKGYYQAFYPELMPKKKNVKKSFYEMIDEL